MNLPPGFQIGQTQGFSGQQTYSNKTLIGGYSDEIALQDDRIRAYISTRDAGKGTVAQRLASRMRRHLQPVYITPQHPDGNVRFGDLIMLQNAVTQGYLSVDLDDKTGENKFGVTTASSNTPLTRNVFRIDKATNPSIEKESRKFEQRKEADIVHYGQKFRIGVPDLDPSGALHLTTELKTASTYSRMTRQQLVSVTCGGNFELCWELLHPDITKRRNLDGQPVKQNTVVVVKHCQTNNNLSSDKIGYTNSFGTEFEVCGHTALIRSSKHRQEEPLPVNCWAVVSAPTGAHYENMLDASFKDSAATLDRVKAKFLERAGNGGFRTLVRILKVLDDNGNRSLDQNELVSGLATYGIRLSDQEAKAVMREFDKDGSGQVSITEFLRGLRGPLNHRRRTLATEAYRRFDKNYDGTVNLADLQAAYGKNIHRHPSVVSGEKSSDQVLLEFASAWDKNNDGTITLQEFLEYYTDVSVNIDDDDYFELMIRNAWHMSGGSGWSENTTCKRVLVVHHDGSQTIQEIKV